ncbi:hypothetical protein ACWD6P_09230 [Streptomyces sp. NPDC002446]
MSAGAGVRSRSGLIDHVGSGGCDAGLCGASCVDGGAAGWGRVLGVLRGGGGQPVGGPLGKEMLGGAAASFPPGGLGRLLGCFGSGMQVTAPHLRRMGAAGSGCCSPHWRRRRR